MIQRGVLANYLQDYLACKDFFDYAPNGLQIEGVSTIKRVCTAVTASEDIIKKSMVMKADALLVHHGYFWQGEDAVITGIKRQRIGALIKQNMNLFAYHLPLDCHPVIGNNACFAKVLDIGQVQRHAVGKNRDLLWLGEYAEPLSAESLLVLLTGALNRRPLHVSGTNKPIRRIAWCTGAAQDLIEQAHQLGVDAFLSGEISERTYHQAQELRLHYFACGHHATERYGIQALGAHLHEKFGLEHHYIESDNPI
jgi:dinuclear metal center YbgI/SA1388 family protein